MREDLLRRLHREIEAKHCENILHMLASLHPADIAELMEHLDTHERRFLLSIMDTDLIADVLPHLSDDILVDILHYLDIERLSEVVPKMEADQVADLLQELPKVDRSTLLSHLPLDSIREIESLSQYPEHSAGGIMTTEYIALPYWMKIDEAIQTLRQKASKLRDVGYIYVVDENNRLRGVLPLKRLILGESNKTLGELMDTEILAVDPLEDQEAVAKLMQKYDLLAIPVVNKDGKLLGIVTADKAMEVLEQETEEDLFHLTGLEKEESVFTPTLSAVRNRLPWILFSLLTTLLSSNIVRIFRHTLEKAIALTMFMPIVAAIGGNVGMQTLTVVVRSLSLGEITAVDILAIFWRQFVIAGLLGALVGIAGFIEAIIIFQVGVNVATVVGLALWANIIGASIFGLFVPLLFKKLGIDPALAASPFILILIDCVGYTTLLGLGTLMLIK